MKEGESKRVGESEAEAGSPAMGVPPPDRLLRPAAPLRTPMTACPPDCDLTRGRQKASRDGNDRGGGQPSGPGPRRARRLEPRRNAEDRPRAPTRAPGGSKSPSLPNPVGRGNDWSLWTTGRWPTPYRNAIGVTPRHVSAQDLRVTGRGKPPLGGRMRRTGHSRKATGPTRRGPSPGELRWEKRMGRGRRPGRPPGPRTRGRPRERVLPRTPPPP